MAGISLFLYFLCTNVMGSSRKIFNFYWRSFEPSRFNSFYKGNSEKFKNMKILFCFDGIVWTDIHFLDNHAWVTTLTHGNRWGWENAFNQCCAHVIYRKCYFQKMNSKQSRIFIFLELFILSKWSLTFVHRKKGNLEQTAFLTHPIHTKYTKYQTSKADD